MAAADQTPNVDAEVIAEIDRVWSLADKDQGGTIDAKELFGMLSTSSGYRTCFNYLKLQN